MKKELIISLLLMFNVTLAFSQKWAAYKQSTSASVKLTDPLELAKIHQQNAYNRQLQRNAKEPYYIGAKNSAITAFKSKNYEQCIYYYESSKKMGFYNGEFEYVAGVSYNELAIQSGGNKQFVSKAKKLLKKARKHGYVLAIPYLNRNF